MNVRKECIEFQAAKQYEMWHNPDSNHNWNMAEESLKIFPSWIRQIPNGIQGRGIWSTGHCLGIEGSPRINHEEGCFLVEFQKNGVWTVQWIACREYTDIVFVCPYESEITARLTAGNRNKEGFYFYANGKHSNLCHFIREFEHRLGLTELTLFSLTDHHNFVWIKPSQFWFQEGIRFSLFTLLVRKGTGHMFNFDQTVNEMPTAIAIKRFLNGHRHYTGSYRSQDRIGWIDTFSYGSSMLV